MSATKSFRLRGASAGFVKPVLVESHDDCEALAAEIVGLVTRCLGYSGREPIERFRAIRERSKSARVLSELALGDVERPQHSSQLVVAARDRKGGPGFWTPEQLCLFGRVLPVALVGSGCYRARRSRYTVPIEKELAEHVIEVKQRRLQLTEMTAAEEQLRLEQCVLVEDVVTEKYFKAQLNSWWVLLAAVRGCGGSEINAEQ